MKKALTENIRVLEISKQIEGVRVGKIVNVDESGQAFVDFSGNTQGPISARFTNSIKPGMLQKTVSADRDVLLVFENNDPEFPIIIDTLYSLVDEITEYSTIALETKRPKDVLIDGKRVTFDAKEEIVLRCGKASITLNRSGKIVIKGAYLLSRSSGINKIKGGAVHIN
ncbi:MAG: hypothetical protein JRG74_13065 [Deltaproteobacteria bacterium]|nr:hypothetical protein [Deltaproteobacteria bacterium]MBW2647500.1 hypothetical protein [Deltaproteobacteria bacterium]